MELILSKLEVLFKDELNDTLVVINCTQCRLDRRRLRGSEGWWGIDIGMTWWETFLLNAFRLVPVLKEWQPHIL